MDRFNDIKARWWNYTLGILVSHDSGILYIVYEETISPSIELLA